MPTLQAIRNRLISDLGIGYTISSIDSLTTTSLTQSSYLRNPNWGGNQFINWLIHRPDAATTADVYRYAGLLTNSTGAITIAGANYTDVTATSETLNILEPGVRPDQDIDPAINRALEYCAFQTVEPLSLAADAAMRETGFTSWGTLVNATAAKQTTASRVFPGMGIRSMAVTCTSANGYQPTVNIPVTPSEMIYIGTISRVNSGVSATVQLWDATNSVAFGTNTIHSESTWQYMQQIEVVPATCRNINVRLQGVGASDVIDWQALWVVRSSILRYNLPSYLDERYKVDSISQLSFTMATSGSTGIVMQALSINPADLTKDQYDADFPMPEANPTYVQFHPGFWRELWARRFGPRYGPGQTGSFPLVIQMRIPYSERGVLVLEADITTCPLHLIVPASEVQLLQSSPTAQKNATKNLQECRNEFAAASAVRATKGPARTAASWRMPRLVN